jgi:hypothetical protein
MGEELYGETSPDEVEKTLEGTRDRLGGLLSELTRRRRDVTNVRLQLGRHRTAVLATLGSVLAFASGGIALAMRRARNRRRFGWRAQRLRGALGRMIAHPERVAGGESTVGRAVAKVALTSFVGVMAKRLAAQSAAAIARRRGQPSSARAEPSSPSAR